MLQTSPWVPPPARRREISSGVHWVQRNTVQNVILACLLALLFPALCAVTSHCDHTLFSASLTGRIPPRPAPAVAGSEFGRGISGMKGVEREQAIMAELRRGNLPESLRDFKPVRLSATNRAGETIAATIFVMPDYLAVGSDRDFLYIPMDLDSATDVARRFGCILPTPKMVDAIYEQATCRLQPQPLPPGPQMRSTAYYCRHSDMIRRQSLALGLPPGTLVSGHKKDLVLTNLLSRNERKVAIYGWHRSPGSPIQPLSTLHGARYVDYSHGVRLVSTLVFIDGESKSIYEVLEDPRLAPVLSGEGPIHNVLRLMAAPDDSYAQLSSHPGLFSTRSASARAANPRPPHGLGSLSSPAAGLAPSSAMVLQQRKPR